MAKVNIHGPMEESTLASGIKTSLMEKVHTGMLTAGSSKVISLMTTSTEKEES